MVQVNERVSKRREQRVAADAVQQALLQAKAREQEQFEAIKAEFSVDTSTVRSASCHPQAHHTNKKEKAMSSV